jgi:hypothetical protein
MATNAKVYEELNRAWKATCHILLGEEIGELKAYEDWLADLEKLRTERSAVSGNEVYLGVKQYCKDARFVSFNEIDFGKRFEPLSINEIKDIDSIVESVRERVCYAGDLLIGNCRFVESSSNITDSNYIYRSWLVDNAQHVAYSDYVKDGRYVFGTNDAVTSGYIIKGYMSLNLQRGFGHNLAVNSSDIYYGSNLWGCSDCIFCFNLRNKRHAIGNLELTIERYKELKKKIVSEIASELKDKKSIPSIFEMVSQLPGERSGISVGASPKFDIKPIDGAFKKTYSLLLKREPSHIDEYRDFLLKNIPQLRVEKDSETNLENLVGGCNPRIVFPKKRGISFEEAAALFNARSIASEDAGRVSLHDTIRLAPVAFINTTCAAGNNQNVSKAQQYYNSNHCYFGSYYSGSQYSAFSFWPRDSSYAFGSSILFDSSFCINCYYSRNLTRSFEADGCKLSSDIYFAHNCENVHDSMFCFNAKNLKNAIGNAPLPSEQYGKVKNSLLEQIADELDKKKDLKWNIYNVGRMLLVKGSSDQ